ncbi:hypothetical protein CO666_14055 [Rhizobium chutanense]|uniref:Uncharacterized protein n=1 Tax=Rhizobium chutanense TaxID=2035448 RepID=A0A2A6JCI0_9HYPH|nr:hypothetical protein [Rhizobium chutanense]PDT03682.1 hypothetical protein CO666_14055 [Rhizobium chutanense]
MARDTRSVPKRNDATLIEFFVSVAEIIGADQLQVLVAGQDRTWKLPVADSSEEERNWIRSSELFAIHHISVSIPHVQVTIDRRPEQHRESGFDLALFDPLLINVEATNNSPSPMSVLQAKALAELVDEYFGESLDLIGAAFKDPKSLQAVLRSHQSIIERLQRMTLEVGQQTTDARRRLDEEYTELKRQLEEQTAELRLESQKALDAERLLLAQRADEIKAKARALDDRDNTHVRRELHEKLKARLADRFKKLDLTPETKSARLPIHFGVAATGIILAILIYAFTSEALAVTANANSTTAERILAIAKSATASIGFLGVISWYLRWMNRWFERLADSEFHLKQFELDITRAQWVVETAFEWKMSQQSPIPDQLLENISRNLFVTADKDETADMHPADYLASALIGKASNVKLAVPGAEIELGPKALKAAAAN